MNLARTSALALFALALATVTYAAKNPIVGGKEMFPNKNIVENAVNSADHTTLVAAVKAAGLVETLQGAGPFTVFAPTNAAFQKLPAGTVETLLKPENKPTLTKVLTYHVVAGSMFWIVRTTGDPMSLGNSLASEVRNVDPEVVAAQIRPLDRYLSEAVAPRRFSLSLMAVFALTALALAITGIYAVVMYAVSQRAREIGIRVALGASRANIVRLVVGHGIRFILIGLTAGITMAAGTTRLIAAMFFGIAATDAATITQVVVCVAAFSVVACAVPTARAERLIVSALKAE